MEIETLLEMETSLEHESFNESLHEDSQISIPSGQNQIEIQGEENNMVEEQSVSQEQIEEIGVNLKQQIDVKTLITEETKQYIQMEEMKKIMKSSMTQQMSEIQETIEKLKEKISQEKNKQQREEIDAKNEKNKLLGLKNFTEATRQIVDVLKSYIENFEQQMSKLKFAALEKRVVKKHEENCNMINEKITEGNKIESEIKSLKSEYEVILKQHKSELEELRKSFEAEEESLRLNLDSALKEEKQLRDELLKIDQNLQDKNEEKSRNSVEIKEIFEYANLKNREELSSRILKIQDLETKRDGLLKSSAELATRVAVLEQEKLGLEVELEKLQDELSKISQCDEDESNVDEMELIDLEQEQEHLAEELEKLNEQIIETKKEHDGLIESNHEKKVALLKAQNTLSNLQHELIFQKHHNETEQNEIEKLKTEAVETEDIIKKKQDELETAEKEHDLIENTKKEFEAKMERLPQELSDKKDQLNYLRNTLQVHLENKSRDLKANLEEKDKAEKKKFADIEAANKKKKDLHQRLRNHYLTLKSSSSMLDQPEIQRNRDSQPENNETINAGGTSKETSPKSILKSPGKNTATTTPTKNVKFVGISPCASSNSSEMVNVKRTEKHDPFDELKKNLIQNRRVFD